MKKRVLKYCFVCMFMLNVFNVFGEIKSGEDSLNIKPDTTAFHIARTNCWLINAGYEYKYVELDFLNFSMNLMGDLNWKSNFGHGISTWKFKPIISQNYAVAGIDTKYGSFSVSKDVSFTTNNQQTKLQSVGLEIPYKSVALGFNYAKMTGFNRQNPVNDSITYLKDFIYNPLNIYFRINVYGKLKNPSLYLPRKKQSSSSVDFGYNQINVSNSTDFIPVLRFNQNGQNIEEVKNIFVDKFISKGFCVAMNYELIFPFLKPKASNNFKCIYLEVKASFAYIFAKYEFHTISDTLNSLTKWNTQYSLFKKSSGATSSYSFLGNLVFDFNKILISVKATYQQFNYGLGNTSPLAETNLHISNVRFNAFITFSYRFNAQKTNNRVDALISKFKK